MKTMNHKPVFPQAQPEVIGHVYFLQREQRPCVLSELREKELGSAGDSEQQEWRRRL